MPEDCILLWRVGNFLFTFGCTEDIEMAIRQMYIRGKLNAVEAGKVRDLIGGYDANIMTEMVYPRLKLIQKTIEKLWKP